MANEATKILHGEVASKKAEQTAKETFQTRGTSKDLPEIIISSSQIKNGVNILDLLNSNKITSSKSEARRAINNKAIKINDKLITDEKLIINLNNFDNKNLVKISFGKKKHFVVKII